MDQTNSLVDHLERTAARFPERPALVDPDGSTVSYAELNDRADRIAAFLVDIGVAPGDRVGVIVPKSAVAVTAFLGIMKARAAYVPADFAAPTARNRSIVTDCAVKAVFLAGSAAAILDEWPDTIPRPAAAIFVDDDVPPVGDVATHAWGEVLRFPPGRVPGRSRADLAYILYTSGSTGIPKGVMLSHDNALGFVDWCSSVFVPTEQDRFSSHAPFHFDLSILDIYVALKHGAALHIVSEELGKSPKDLASFIADSKLTVWYSTPSILALLAQYGDLVSCNRGS